MCSGDCSGAPLNPIPTSIAPIILSTFGDESLLFLTVMPSLVSLAEDLLAQAKKLDEILDQNNIPSTSFDKDILKSLPHEAQEIRSDLLDASHNFKQLVRGAKLSGLDIAFSVRFTFVLIHCRCCA